MHTGTEFFRLDGRHVGMLIVAGQFQPTPSVVHLVRERLVDRTLGRLKPTVVHTELTHERCTAVHNKCKS